MSNKSELEQVTDDALRALGAMNGIAPRRLVEDYIIPLIEAYCAELNEAIEDIADDKASEELLEHGRQLAMGWAAFAIAIGQESGWVSPDGVLTDKASDNLRAIHKSLQESHAVFSEAFEEEEEETQEEEVAE